MIYVATAHYKSDKWLDLQLRYLERHLHEPYRVVANFERIDDRHRSKFHRVVDTPGPIAPHAGKLNDLAAEITAEADPDDLIMFLDGDAFPVADPMPVVREGLDRGVLVAVQRLENNGDEQPHPCFCVVRVRDWHDLHGDWSGGYPTRDGATWTDVGGNLRGILVRRDLPWTPLLRSNTTDYHPVAFGVYGGVVYHHGSGFRTQSYRVDEAAQPRRWRWAEGRPVIGTAARKAGSYRITRHNRRHQAAVEAVSDRIYEQIRTDPEFYRQFLTPT
jgi:hypothetical protein